MLPVIAIIGRPNVGKSTIFNRFVGGRQAIESSTPGTTRDRLYENVQVGGYRALLVDTGGLELSQGNDLEENVQEQSRLAIEGADLVLFVVDLQKELTSEDHYAVDLLRRSKRPFVFLANKADNERLEEARFGLFELGLGEPLAVSALHDEGFDVLEETMESELKELGFSPEEQEVDEDRIKIAFVGRPNVGKSTMINALFGKERVVASEVPGTTRDASYIPFEYADYDFTLVDTAGVRRRGRVEKGLEKYSVLRSLQAVHEADICVLMMDFEEGLTSQDCHISEFVLKEGKGLILVVNKIDITPGEVRDSLENRFIRHLKQRMAYVPWAPLVFTSAKDRKNIFSILDLAIGISEERQKEISQDDLSVWLDHTLSKHPPARRRGKRELRVNSVKQVATKPPLFVFKCDFPQLMHFSYARYLENELRDQFGFAGTSIKLVFKRPSQRERRPSRAS